MPDENKLEAVRDYLRKEFPDCSIEESYDALLKAWRFKVKSGGATHQAVVSNEFLTDVDTPGIAVVLQSMMLAEHLRDLGAAPVIVTTSGLRLEFE